MDMGMQNMDNSFLLPSSEYLQYKNYQLCISHTGDPSLRVREIKARFCYKKLFHKE